MKLWRRVLALLTVVALLFSCLGLAEDMPQEAPAQVEEIVEEAAQEAAPEPEPMEEPEVEEPEAEEAEGEGPKIEPEAPAEEPVEELVEDISVEEFDSDDFDSDDGFEIDEDGVLVKYWGPAQDVVIPSSVKEIGYLAFREMPGFEDYPIRSVVILGSVKSVGAKAFMNCKELESVTIEDGVEYFDDLAFQGCEKLASISIPGSVKDIGYGMFQWCSSLTTVNFEGYPASIGDYAFYECTSLVSIRIPKSVKSIGEGAFGYCSSLRSVYIPEGSVTSIGLAAFANCDSLEEIDIPEGVVSLEGIYSCIALKTVMLPRSLKEISGGIFVGCPDVTVYLYKGTPAEDFCKEWDIRYKYRDSDEPPVETDPPATNTPTPTPTPTPTGTGGGTTTPTPTPTVTPTPTPKPDGAISLSFAEKTLSQKETATIKASTEGLKKKEKYSYCSNDTYVATVSKSGKIAAKHPGEATITVTGKTSGEEAYCDVTVLPAPEMLMLNHSYLSCDIGETVQLSATVLPAAALKDVTWSIPKKQRKYASVDEDGLVTALAEGKVTITATTNHKNLKGKRLSKKCTLTVVDPTRPTDIYISVAMPDELTLEDGLPVTFQYGCVLLPLATAESDVTWSIHKKVHRKLATVTKDGLLTAKKPDKVQLKVTAKKKNASSKTLSDTINVTIVDPTIPTSVSIWSSSRVFMKGETYTFRATCEPATAADAELVWSSSNPKVIKVNKTTGEITALKRGKAKITVKAKRGGKKASVNVEVI